MMNKPDFRLKVTTMALALAAPTLFSSNLQALTLKDATELAIKNSPGIMTERINAKLKEADKLIAYKYFDPKIDASYTVNQLGGFEYPDEIETLSLASLNSGSPTTNFLPDEKMEGEFKVSAKKIFLNGVYTEVAVDLKQTDSELTKIQVSPALEALDNGGQNKTVNDYFPMSAGAIKFITRFPLWGRGDLAEAIGDYQNKKHLYDSAQAEIHHKIAKILKEAVGAYWDNRAATQTYALRKESLDRIEKWAAKIHEVINGMENADAVKAQFGSDLDRIEGFVQEKRKDLNNAETALNTSREKLAKSLGITIEKATEMGDATDDMPVAGELDTQFDPAQWSELAINNRMDIQARKLEEKGATEMLDWFMDFNYPEVNLILAAHQQVVDFGNGGPEGYFAALGNPSGDLGYTAGLQFSMKLGNSAGLGRATQATLLKMKAQIGLKQIMQEAGVITKSLASQVSSNIKSADSAAQSANAYRKSVDSSRADKSQTIATAYRQFETERDWINAEADRIQAEADLAKLIAEVRFQTGTLVQHGGDAQEVRLTDLVTLPVK
jgi:outer membrane protein TolC